MKALILGAGGQVGRELQRPCPAGIELVALDRAGLDIGDERAVLDVLGGLRPGVIVNAAAYTQVDKAESEPDLAFRVNAAGPRLLARTAREYSMGASLGLGWGRGLAVVGRGLRSGRDRRVSHVR